MNPYTMRLLAVRLDWGLGNPNKTAALIVTLMVAVWILPFWRRSLFWLALPVFAALGVCLMGTASRGGLVALALGLGTIMARLPRPWARRYVVGAALVVWVIAGASVYLETSRRFGKGIESEDKSITHRLEIWRSAPRMIVDAPGGWGLDNSGAAYMQWYQPLERNEVYRTLVSSHLTWLVEFGWPLRILYVFGWLGVLVFCGTGVWSGCGRVWLGVPLGVWLAFGVTAFFSSVAESPWLWIVPVLSLAGVALWRTKEKSWPRLRSWALAGGGTAALLGAVVALGLGNRGGPELRYDGSLTTLGGGPGESIMVVANPTVLGKNYGRTAREFLRGAAASTMDNKRVGPIIFVPAISVTSCLDLAGKTVVLAGELEEAGVARLQEILPRCDRLVLLNPLFGPANIGVDARGAGKIEVVSGEYSQTPVAEWADLPPRSVRHIEGAGNFLPHWPQFVVRRSNLPP